MLSEEHYVILEAYKRYSGRNAIAYRLNAAETSQNTYNIEIYIFNCFNTK